MCTKQDAQHIDGFAEDFEKTFLLHYKLSALLHREVKRLRGASRGRRHRRSPDVVSRCS